MECWGGRQGGRGLELCVRQLRVCGSQLAVCLVSLFVSVCCSCVSSSSVPRPPIPRWCPVRAWLFFTFLPNLTAHRFDAGTPQYQKRHSRGGAYTRRRRGGEGGRAVIALTLTTPTPALPVNPHLPLKRNCPALRLRCMLRRRSRPRTCCTAARWRRRSRDSAPTASRGCSSYPR